MRSLFQRKAFKVLLALIIGLGVLIGSYAAWSTKYFYVAINGSSMTPTYEDGDLVILKKTHAMEAGHIAVFNLPAAWKKEWLGSDNTRLIKRVAVAPGQTLSWDGSVWYADGEPFSNVLTGSCKVEPMEYTLGEGEVFVAGDTTTGKTMDSREAFCKGISPFVVNKKDIAYLGETTKVFRR